MIKAYLIVGVGGAIGSMVRYGIARLIPFSATAAFPWATFGVNMLGCFLIGVIFGFADRYEWMQGNLLLLLASGFCGGFTTFSTFALEGVGLFDKQFSITAIAYILLSVALGLILCKAGLWLAQ